MPIMHFNTIVQGQHCPIMFLIRNIVFGLGLYPTATVIAVGRNCRGELGGCTSTWYCIQLKKVSWNFEGHLPLRRTVVSDGRDDFKVTGQDFFFRVRGASFHIYSHLFTFFLCFIVLFLSCCSHARVFGKTLVHKFPISYGHTEWNLLSSGTNTLLW